MDQNELQLVTVLVATLYLFCICNNLKEKRRNKKQCIKMIVYILRVRILQRCTLEHGQDFHCLKVKLISECSWIEP